MSISPTPPPPGSKGRSTVERRARERRVLRRGLALSFLLHLLVIAVVGRWLTGPAGTPWSRPDPPAVTVVEGMRVIELAEVADAEPVVEPTVPLPTPVPPRVAPTTPAQGEEAVVEAAPQARRPTAAERLAPRVVDPRLWRPMVLLPREPTLEDVQARIAAATEMLSDSALAEAERALRARDWTVEDARGGRWGISPGQLHLGNITLPLPLFFPVDMQAEAQQALWFELENQLDRAMILESFDTRVRAIRERRERERAERQGPDNGTDP
jgi:hypothetical protein